MQLSYIQFRLQAAKLSISNFTALKGIKSARLIQIRREKYQCDELGEMFRHLLVSKVPIFCANGEYTSAIYALRAWRLTALGVFNKTPLASYAAHHSGRGDNCV